MATEMCFMLVEDSELGRLRRNDDNVARVVEERDAGGGLVAFGVNHRNVEIFHFILNGTTAFVGGPCGLFETWLRGDEYPGIRLTDEAFGLDSTGVRTLSDALSMLDDAAIRDRWGEWKTAHGIAKDDDPSFFPECFGFLRELCSRAVNEKQALVWIAG